MIKAIIWDVDGILIDACAIHRRCFRKACEKYGIEVDEAKERELEGRPTRVKLQMLGVDDSTLAQKINHFKQELTYCEAVNYPFDRSRDQMLVSLRLIYKMGVYTNAVKSSTFRFLRSAGLFDYFDTIITNEDVANPKPDPQGYLKVMEKLGVTPEETLIVEDSPVGIAAAKASGAKVLETDFHSLSLRQIEEACR